MSLVQGWLQGALRKICPIVRDLYNGMTVDLYQMRASQLDTRLHLVRISLESLLPEWNSPGVEQRCEKLFTDLAGICTGKRMTDKMEAWPELCKSFEANNEHRLRKAWMTLLNQKASVRKVQNLIEECEQLVHGFFPFTMDNVSDLTDFDLRDSERPHDCSFHFNAGLFNLLKRHVTCNSGAPCQSRVADQSHHSLQHLSRLCLDICEGDTRERNSNITFLDLLVSAKDLQYWLEVRLKVQRIDQSIDVRKELAPGHFCKLLGQELYACLFLSFHNGADSTPDSSSQSEFYLLEEERDTPIPYKPGRGIQMSEVLSPPYKLSTKDKIMLAHNIALAYWQLYGSKLTNNLWTSNSICFMEQENLGVKDNYHSPLTSCLTLDFVPGYARQPAKKQCETAPVHEFPGILSIGIILLEIALSKPFPIIEFEDTSGTNRRLQIAKARLVNLQQEKWDCFPSKWIFDAAVEECITFRVQQAKQKLGGRRRGERTRDEEAREEEARQKKARDQFYRNVVCRLAYLVKFGFNASGGRVCPRKLDENTSMPLDEPRAEFQTEQGFDKEKWLEDLKKICAHVEKQRRENEISDRIKVAILDTGCDLSLLPAGADGHMKEWKDFTEQSVEHPQDKDGHGTLMTRLVLECAPSAEVIVGRIAKDRKSLRGNQARVAQAIHWAGINREAHIISMSFGFPKADYAISRAIENVKWKRPVIFLSSAGNSSRSTKTFPASHPSVISIYAANREGTFSESNASIGICSEIALTTFGDNIPQGISAAFKAREQFRDVCRPGTSIATAVAAGISATMLAYTTLLAKVMDPYLSTRRLRWIWTTEGMEAVLKKSMARSQADQVQKRFLDPVWFWMQHPTDCERFSSIVTNLADVDNQGQLHTDREEEDLIG